MPMMANDALQMLTNGKLMKCHNGNKGQLNATKCFLIMTLKVRTSCIITVQNTQSHNPKP